MLGLAKACIPFMIFAIGAIPSGKAGFTAAVARFSDLLPGPNFVQLHQSCCLVSFTRIDFVHPGRARRTIVADPVLLRRHIDREIV